MTGDWLPSPSMLDEARRIHDSLPVVDGHNDLPWMIHTRGGGSLVDANPAGPLPQFHTDFPRLLAGGVGVQFWSVYVPAWTQRPLEATHRQIDLVIEMSERAPDATALVDSAEAAVRVRDGGRVAGLLGAEGGHCLEGSLDAVAALRERGVRYLTLTHADTIDWADSATDAARHGGLTEFGREVVAEMNRVGMLVDVSHVAEATMRHATEASRAPVIASHSCAHALAAHPRNVPDDVVEEIAAGGGVVMVTFVPAFLVAETARVSLDMFEERRVLRARFDPDDEAGYEAAAQERFGAVDLDRGSVSDVVDHIEHLARIGGVDAVGIGSDFDGTEQTPEGLEDVSCYPAITADMLVRGWSESDIRKILGGNALRVLAEVDG